MSFQEQLKKARLARGYTQQQVADALGITNSAYCGYETGKRQPDVAKIKQIANILKTSGDILLETGFGADTEKSPAPAEADTGDKRLDGIIENYHQLNEYGQQQLAEQAEHLTYVPKYKKCNSVSEEETEVG